MSKEKFGGVYVYIEQRRGVIQEASLQLLGEARKLAEKLKTEVSAFLIGYQLKKLVKEPIYYGADKVIYVDNKECANYNPEIYKTVLVQLVMKYKPEIFLIAGTKYGRELAPSIAADLETGITADCTAFDIDEKGNLLQIRPPFGGRVHAYIITPEKRPQMATARPNVFPLPERNVSRKGEIIKEETEVPKPSMALIKFEKGSEAEIPIEKAEVLISFGRGFNLEDAHLLEELCGFFLKSSISCSRPIVDAGLMPRSRQVGQTGKTVRPKLYLAIGISGAIQHLAGMKDSKFIAAINKDPNAEIFKFCDFGIIGDYKEVIPLLIEELKKKQAPS